MFSQFSMMMQAFRILSNNEPSAMVLICIHMYICYLPAGRSVLGKNVLEVLSTALLSSLQSIKLYY